MTDTHRTPDQVLELARTLRGLGPVEWAREGLRQVVSEQGGSWGEGGAEAEPRIVPPFLSAPGATGTGTLVFRAWDCGLALAVGEG